MFAATAAGIHKNIEDAMSCMGRGFDVEYQPNPNNTILYARRFIKYQEIGQRSYEEK